MLLIPHLVAAKSKHFIGPDIVSGMESISLYVLISNAKVRKKLDVQRKNYGSVATSSWLLLQYAKAPFTRSTRAPTYKATEMTISNIAQFFLLLQR